MGLCSSKSIATTEVVPFVAPDRCAFEAEVNEANNGINEMLMDRVHEASVNKSKALVVGTKVLLRYPENAVTQYSPALLQKISHSADDIPISSTYHRVHSAEVAMQEEKRQEEVRREAEQRALEVREYISALQIASTDV
ncbi:hypothetical protein CCR75_001897 [Bremia lactucae]|uniref:Uncharacterized protein n=1 Tax=Bremia lactucae TaxID=4779 RepID=A0A976FH98_BRELC|nr:hypothetical protein CCR75_001897 [Bremia lactucae]